MSETTNFSAQTLVDLVMTFFKSDQGQAVLKQILDEVLDSIKKLFPSIFPVASFDGKQLSAMSLSDFLLGLFKSDIGQEVLKAVVAAILAGLKNVLPGNK